MTDPVATAAAAAANSVGKAVAGDVNAAVATEVSFFVKHPKSIAIGAFVAGVLVTAGAFIYL